MAPSDPLRGKVEKLAGDLEDFKSLESIDYLKKFHDEDWHTPRGRAIREIVFGANDGLVSTMGFVAGITGSIADSRLVLLAGLAEMFAGAISMFFGAYISSKSQREFFEKEIRRERREIEEKPEEEQEEMRVIYRDMGFEKEEVDTIVSRLTRDKKSWLRIMLREELGIVVEELGNPLKVGVVIGISFIIGAIPPILPYIFMGNAHSALKVALPISLAAMFAIGAWKTRITKTGWLMSGLEMLAIGSAAAGIGYALGRLASHLLV